MDYSVILSAVRLMFWGMTAIFIVMSLIAVVVCTLRKTYK